MNRVKLSLATLLGLLCVLNGAAGLAYAAPPPNGVVVEGYAVPGVALGASRTSATSAWGQASYCQGATASLCTYNLSMGSSTVGSADLTFTGPNGGPATGGGSDVVATIDWIGFPRWRTIAGVTTASALARPNSVLRAYPHAQVERYGDGHLYRVLDNHLGIQVEWIPLTYSSQFYVQIQTFPGTDVMAVRSTSDPSVCAF